MCAYTHPKLSVGQANANSRRNPMLTATWERLREARRAPSGAAPVGMEPERSEASPALLETTRTSSAFFCAI